MPQRSQTANPDIAERLRALRISQRISQAELARRVGIRHREIISAIENGHRPVPANELTQFAQAFGVSLASLIDSGADVTGAANGRDRTPHGAPPGGGIQTSSTTHTKEFLGKRLRILRRRRDMRQVQLAEKMGMKDRQIISAIENGRRLMSVPELERFARALGVSVDDFTNPLETHGDEHFTWQITRSRARKHLPDIEKRAGALVATYRWLAPASALPLFRHSLLLPSYSEPRDAASAATRFVEEFFLTRGIQKLRPVWPMRADPKSRSEWLWHITQREFGILLIILPLHDHIPSGRCRIPFFDTIFIDQSLSASARAKALSVELFGLLTDPQQRPLQRKKQFQAAANAWANEILGRQEPLAFTPASAGLPRSGLLAEALARALQNNTITASRAATLLTIAPRALPSYLAEHTRSKPAERLQRASEAA